MRVKNGNYFIVIRRTINGSFSVVSHYILVEICMLLESPFHAELNGLCPSSVY